MSNIWKEFDFMWGMAPPGSLKYKKAQEVIAFIRKHFIECSKVEEIIGEDEKTTKYEHSVEHIRLRKSFHNELRKEQRAKLLQLKGES